jgi:hypothetical protein
MLTSWHWNTDKPGDVSLSNIRFPGKAFQRPDFLLGDSR